MLSGINMLLLYKLEANYLCRKNLQQKDKNVEKRKLMEEKFTTYVKRKGKFIKGREGKRKEYELFLLTKLFMCAGPLDSSTRSTYPVPTSFVTILLHWFSNTIYNNS